MAVRALIIAAENYPSAHGGMPTSLPGTLQAGIEFRDWLLAKLRAEGRDTDAHIVFCSEPPQTFGRGATSRDILTALRELKEKGRGATEELFFFFSGHGFAFVEGPGSRPDVIISSDYTDPFFSGHCFLKLDTMVSWLRDHLGPGKHYYFIDACRNRLNSTNVAGSGQLQWDAQVLADASSFILQSTVEGALGAASGAFPQTLLAGLRGKGKAKIWDPNDPAAMIVRYDSLRAYLKEMLQARQPITSKVEGEHGESDVVFKTIKPVQNVQCVLEIEGHSAADQGAVVVQRVRSVPEPPIPFEGVVPVLELPPDKYVITISINGIPIEPLFPNATRGVDLYEDQTLRFKKAAAGGGLLDTVLEKSSFGAPQGKLVQLAIDIPANSQASVRNIETGEEHTARQGQTLRLVEGTYAATIRDTENRLLLDAKVELAAGTKATLRPSDPRVSIANKLPSGDEGLFFSESMGGGVADPDLSLWLSLLGAGRILRPHGEYSKIAPFPLHNFSNEPPGASPLFVLAALEEPTDRALQVGITQGGATRWHNAGQPMPGIREVYIPSQAGPQLVSFRSTQGASYTVASHTSPNRGTLIILILNEDQELCVSQFLLPLGHLVEHLPPEVQVRLQTRNHLNDVKFISEATRAFRKRHNVLKMFSQDHLNALLYTKWLDPIAACLAGYELLRRGDRKMMPQVVANMTQFFPDFPDSAALAKLSGRDVARPPGPPLFLDGLRAFPDYPSWLPLPASHLDFTSPWTAWRAAVR